LRGVLSRGFYCNLPIQKIGSSILEGVIKEFGGFETSKFIFGGLKPQNSVLEF